MVQQNGLGVEEVTAHVAHEGTLTGVRSTVVVALRLVSELLVTELADERAHVRVQLHVTQQPGAVSEALVTPAAREPLHALVCVHVRL